MIAHLRGSIHRVEPGEVSIDVHGVGYRVLVPMDVWDSLEEGSIVLLWISTYVREDRLDLFGFTDRAGRTLFEEFIKMSGIGPRMGLELCSVPRTLLLQAVHQQDERILTGIKGVGKKSAEKLLVELKSLFEKHPDIFGTREELPARSEFDQDAIAALASLGYDNQTILRTLKSLSPDLKSTEERVAAALRTL